MTIPNFLQLVLTTPDAPRLSSASLGIAYLLAARHGGALLKELLLLSVPLRFIAGWIFWSHGDAWKPVCGWEVSMGLLNGISLLWT
jgi:hypothetical protein